MTRTERITNGLLGLLVGDALGVPYEFHAPNDIPPLEQIEYAPPAGFRRAHAGTPHGTWSDDGAQAFCLLASLLECGAFNADDFGARLVRWRDTGYLAVDGRVFDVGITTQRAISSLKMGTPALSAGPAGVSDNGNGSLMRCLPLALWHSGTAAELVRDAHAQSLVTHGHVRSQVCCALYCLWARYELNEHADAWAEAVRVLRELYQSAPIFLHELNEHVRPDDITSGTGSGYVVDCLRSAHACVEAGGSYEQIVRRAISLGNDTDTTACVAGGIAGVRTGGLPERWLAGLRGQDLLSPLMDALLARA